MGEVYKLFGRMLYQNSVFLKLVHAQALDRGPPWPPPLHPGRQSVGSQYRQTSWPTFDFYTTVDLEEALSCSWHTFQLVELCFVGGRLFYLATK